MGKRLTVNEFIERANKIHNNFYDYSQIKFTKGSDKIDITCPHHGTFTQIGSEHLRGIGCKKCGFILMWKNRRPTNEKFIQKANKIHDFRYNYSKTIYSGWDSTLTITCKEHGDFLQSAHVHLSGAGCQECSLKLNGWSRGKFIERCKNKNGILYFVALYNESELFIKIGITSKSVKRRLRNKKQLGYDFVILKEIIDEGGKIWDMEKDLHKKFKNFKYLPKLSFGGQYECFDIKILKDIYEL